MKNQNVVGYVVGENTPNYLKGRMLTIVEALGLKDTQEKSLKDLISNEIWAEFREKCFISSEFHTEIKSVAKEIEAKEKENCLSDVPCGGKRYSFSISYKEIE